MIGDVVGEPGLQALEEGLPKIIAENSVDIAIVNGENAAAGFGLDDAAFARILAAGADVVTSGNHVWEQRDFWQTLETDARVLRPANYPPPAAGRGWLRIEKAGAAWVVINAQGRELMTPIDCPFRGFDQIIAAACPADAPSAIVLVDFHAESTREKESFAYHADGRAAVVAGTHTHVQTADERVLPNGAAYITDLGMTGVLGAVLGMDAQICMDRARRQVLYRMEPAAQGSDAPKIQGIIAEIDADSGKALSIRRI